MKTNELTGKNLDLAVALALGATDLRYDTVATWWVSLDGKDRALSSGWSDAQNFNPSTNWTLAGPILSSTGISRTTEHSGLWIAYWTDGYGEDDESKQWMQCDRSELVAGLRCFVAMKLGEEVNKPNMPKELI